MEQSHFSVENIIYAYSTDELWMVFKVTLSFVHPGTKLRDVIQHMYEKKSDHNIIIWAKDCDSLDEFTVSTFLEQKIVDRIAKKLNDGDYFWEPCHVPRKFINDFGDEMTQEEIESIKLQEAYLLTNDVDFTIYKLKLVIDLFPFYLYKRNLSKISKVKQELILLKNMKTSINKELTLFNTYFF